MCTIITLPIISQGKWEINEKVYGTCGDKKDGFKPSTSGVWAQHTSTVTILYIVLQQHILRINYLIR